MKHRLFWTIIACLVAAPVLAVVDPGGSDPGAVRLPMETALRAPTPLDPGQLSKAPAWTSFTARHGEWQAMWNGWSGTVHRAFGRGIAVSGPVDTAADAARIAEEFLRDQSALTKADAVDLELAASLKGGRIWYANFTQHYQGIPLLNADVTVRLDQSGRVVMFGSDARTDIDLDPTPLLSAATARSRAREGLTYDVNADGISGGDDLFVLPVDRADGTRYHLVRHVRVSQASPRHEWETFVDAHNGEIIWRFDRVRHGSVQGNVEVNVRLIGPTDGGQVPMPCAHMEVSIDGNTVVTDANGDYSVGGLSGTHDLEMRLQGPFVNVNNFPAIGVDALYSVSLNTDTDPTEDFLWQGGTHSAFAERMGFYHTNVVHDWITAIDPGFTQINYSMPCLVNDTSDECNAFWDGTGINFYAQSPGGVNGTCNNIAYVADVVYHEYGHGINDNLYEQAGSPFGMTNGALHEGMADVVATLLQDDPELGEGFFRATPVGIRNVDNTNSFPFDVANQVHNDGLIIGGTFWDLRERIGVTAAADLHHFARYGIPQDPNLAITYQEYFLETLIADDDNGDLGDQTPHWADILESFNLHGIGPSLFVAMSHTPQADTDQVGTPITIASNVTSSSALFPLDVGSVEVTYAVDAGGDASVAMANTGGNTYEGDIPGQAEGALVGYYVAASAVGGSPLFNPPIPTVIRNTFFVGTQTQVALYDMEADAGWTVNDGTDTAVTGIWERADPQGVQTGGEFTQPNNDNTAGGTDCWVTGNGHDPNVGPGFDDVDDGKTTLLSPIFDATGLFRPAICYYRWYTNNLGSSPGSDVWAVDISNDGGSTWTPVESTTASLNQWTKLAFQLDGLITPTNNMQMRFVADDAGSGSVVEAAVDDWELIEFDAVVGIGDGPARPLTLALEQNNPNPFNPSTEIAFSIPRAGTTTLAIYDLAGRRVNTLVNGHLPAGRHSVRWSGTDRGGASVASGVYIYRLESGDTRITRRMVLLK